jgi:hypothetical protein
MEEVGVEGYVEERSKGVKVAFFATIALGQVVLYSPSSVST